MVRNAREDGKNILHLGFGQSPFPVHSIIRDEVAANSDKNQYLPSAGLSELRDLAVGYFAEKFGFAEQEFVPIVGPGSKDLIFAIQHVVDGDLLLPVPSWVSYAPQTLLTQDQILKIPTSIEDGYQITAINLDSAISGAIKAGKNPKKLILNYPNNPTGLTLTSDQLKRIAQVCRRYGILVISDEIYGLVNFKFNHCSIASHYPEGTILTTGLSKHLSLGGYRLGFAFVPKKLHQVYESLIRVASETWSCVAAPIQYAVRAALRKDPAIEEYIRTCTRIHHLVGEYVRDTILALGIEYPGLEGAFYQYPDFAIKRDLLRTRGVETSDRLAVDLMDKTQIATLPGTAFGDLPENLRLRLATCDYDGETALDYVRAHPECTSETLINACCPNIRLACDRLSSYFEY